MKSKTEGWQSGRIPSWANPADPDAQRHSAMIQSGLRAFEAGDMDAARRQFRSVLDENIEHPDALMGMGLVARVIGHDQTAAELLRRSVGVNPRSGIAWSNLASALLTLELLEDAVQAAKEAVKILPNHPDVLKNLASILNHVDRPYESIQYFQKAIKVNRNSTESLINYGSVLSRIGEYGAADRHFKRALKDAPADPVGNFHYSMNLMKQGKWKIAWPLYEWRFLAPSYESSLRKIDITHGLPEDLEGKSVLLFREQGIGDEMRFATMIDEVLQRNGRVTFECSEKLSKLFQRSFPDARVLKAPYEPSVEEQNNFDFRMPCGSLGKYLRLSRHSFPRNQKLFKTDTARVAGFRARLHAMGPELKVGISWRSSLRGVMRNEIYASVEDLEPLFKVPGVKFISLQYDDCAEELSEIKRKFGVDVSVFSDVDLYDDIDGSAALTEALDFVVSANTSVAPIAGGVRTPGIEFFGSPVAKNYPIDGGDPWFSSITPMGKRPSETWGRLMKEIAAILDNRAKSVRETKSE